VLIIGAWSLLPKHKSLIKNFPCVVGQNINKSVDFSAIMLLKNLRLIHRF